MEINGHDSIDLLKIDIEGFEYEVLESCLAAEIPIKQICVEFHDFFPDIPKTKTKNLILALQSHGFDLIHRHRHDHTFLKRDAGLIPVLANAGARSWKKRVLRDACAAFGAQDIHWCPNFPGMKACES